MSRRLLCDSIMDAEEYVDENGGSFENDAKAESRKFNGEILHEGNCVLVIRDTSDKELGPLDLNGEMEKEHLNSNTNNNNANDNSTTSRLPTSKEFTSKQLQIVFSTTLKYLAFLKRSNTTGSKIQSDLDDKEMHFFLVHTLASGDEETKSFLEKSLKEHVSKTKASADAMSENHRSPEPLLICFPCRLTFTFGPSFAGHVINHHGLDLSDLEVQVMELDNINAVLQSTQDNCQVSFLDPIHDSKTLLKLENFSAINEKLRVNEVIKSKAGPADCGLLDVVDKRKQNKTREKRQKGKNSSSKFSGTKEEQSTSTASSTAAGRISKTFANLVQQSATAVEKLAHQDRTSVSKQKRSSQTDSFGHSHDEDQGLDLTLANESQKQPYSISLTSSATVAKQRMLDCKTMSFAVASPLDPHSQSPTAHPSLIKNVMHSDTSNFTHDSKSKGVEFAAFLSQRKADTDQVIDENAALVSSSQSFVSSTPPLSFSSSSKKNVRSSSSPVSPGDHSTSSSLLTVPLGGSSQNDVDSLLNTSTSTDSMFPISLFQSRNSCKTLKCPKCNWHYKYRQTLEAHMKEKHFDEASDCVYCNTGQPHPRLSRGESYSCGYKPFKCNVCNYSTTTKGNLSIHMQSDKHLYNARSLQQRQQDLVRQGGTSLSGSTSQAGESVTSQNDNGQQSGVKRSASPGSGKITEYNGLSLEKHLQSRRRRSSNKTSSSVDSGVYSSTSKIDSPTSAGGRRESGSSSGGKWRCDVCCYETTIARNLRIHMTSEKHAQNLALSEKGLLTHLRQDNDANRGRTERNSSSEVSQLTASNLIDYYAAVFKTQQQPDTSGKALADADDVRKAQAQYLQHQLFLAQHQQLLLAQQYQQIMMAAAASSLQQRFSQSADEPAPSGLNQSKQQELMLHKQIWKQLFPKTSLETVAAAPEGKSETKESSFLFSCGLCGIFGTDDINSLENHVRKQRPTEGLMDPGNSEWVVKERNRDRENYFCKLCAYSTTLKTNFNLHCKTEKHSCKLNLISHVREGGSATAWMIPHIIRGNVSQSVACNACQFVTHSLEKLKIHCATDQHQGVSNVCQYLQSLMKSHSKSSADGKMERENTFKFRCLPCSSFSTQYVVEMVKHMQTTEHQAQLQNQKNPASGTLQDVVTIENCDLSSTENRDTEKKETATLHCDYCNYSCDERARMHLHAVTQHSDQPLTPCPLCQELLKSPLQLRIHLLKAHQLQTSPVESNKNLNGNPTKPIGEDMGETNHVLRHLKELEDVEKSKNDLSMEFDTSGQGNLVIDEDPTFQGREISKPISEGQEVIGDGPQNNLEDSLLDSSTSQIQDSNNLIMQALETGKISASIIPARDSPSLPQAKNTKTVVQDNSAHITHVDPNSNSGFSDSSDLVKQPCPDSVELVSKNHARRHLKRTRIRSCSSEEYPGKSYCHLLSKYGLEQARHYVESRSSLNKGRARTFRREKEEERWSASFSDPDVSEKEMVSIELDKTRKQVSDSSRNHQESLTCRQCGKEFSGIWILKAHEEMAHGVAIPTANIREDSSAFSEHSLQEKAEEIGEIQNRESFSTNNLTTSNVTAASLLAPPQDKDSAALEENAALQQQQLQSTALLQALLKMQSMKQADAVDSELSRNASLGNLHPGTVFGDAGSISANLMSQMGMYSALFQSQALGLHPYQMLSSVAALQQMQQIGTPSVIGIPEEISGRASGSTFSGNLQQTAAMSSFENQFRSHGLDALQKQDLSNSLENASLFGHLQNQSSMEIPAKRPRTRITDEQLKILRANFDINNSPSEDQIDEMARLTGLPPKVIKHWFRNTLFKERQRSKDSPYNFNIPPVLSLEDAQKSISEKQEDLLKGSEGLSQEEIENQEEKREVHESGQIYLHHEDMEESGKTDSKVDAFFAKSSSDSNNRTASSPNAKNMDAKTRQSSTSDVSKGFPAGIFANSLSLLPNLSPGEKTSEGGAKSLENIRETQPMLNLTGLNFSKQLLPSHLAWKNQTNTDNESSLYDGQSIAEHGMFPSIPSNLCRRTPRTRFTDFQLQVLQEFFDRNAYPKDDDLDKLSQTLNLSTRVIVVWFQNARQKARKNYEQQQQQYHQQSHTPPGLDPIRSSLKLEERLLAQTATKGFENIAKKTQTDINKLSADKFDSKSRQTDPKSGDIISIACTMCEKTLPSFEEWNSHQQEHLTANFASIFNTPYMKGLVDSHNLDKVESKQPVLGTEEENKAKLALANQTNLSLSSSSSSKMTPENDNYSTFSKFFTEEKQPSLSSTQKHSNSPSLLGATKRKVSTSPTLPQFPSALKNVPTPTPAALHHNKISSFADDKEGGGMQKDPKRLRTTITPDQLEYLYQQYLFDSSPSRKVIEQISEVVGLKKRVVQVWFQNTRARERKGQFRSSIARCVTNQMAQNKLCHLCRMIFRSKEELDHHIQTKHVAQIPDSTTLSSDGPAEKKMKFAAQTESEVKDLPNLQAVKSLMNQEQLKSSVPNFSHLINSSSLTTNSVQSIKSEPPVTSNLPSNSVKEEPFPSSSASQSLDYNQLFGRTQSHLSSVDLQAKLAALYSSSSTKSLHSSNNSFSKLADSSGISSITRTSPQNLKEMDCLESVAAVENDRKISDSSIPEEDRKAVKPREVMQQLSHQSGLPSMVSNNSLLDVGCTPTKRHRTQMTHGQVRALKHCYKAFKTPTLAECELMGSEIGLAKRVVRVWFQNARAKEKKQKLRQSSAGQEMDTGGFLENDDVISQCDVCLPVIHFTSSQRARDHYFSRDHLQKLVKVMEIEKKQDGGPGFSTSHSSPCSSYDSSENPLNSENFGSDSLSDPASPMMKHLNESNFSSSLLGPKDSSSVNSLPVLHRNEELQQSTDDVLSVENYRKFSESNSVSGNNDQMNADYSQLFATNPNLFQHYQKAVQQLLSQQGQKDQENASQALFQQALQKSLYQILKLPQTSAESQ